MVEEEEEVDRKAARTDHVTETYRDKNTSSLSLLVIFT